MQMISNCESVWICCHRLLTFCNIHIKLIPHVVWVLSFPLWTISAICTWNLHRFMRWLKFFIMLKNVSHQQLINQSIKLTIEKNERKYDVVRIRSIKKIRLMLPQRCHQIPTLKLSTNFQLNYVHVSRI